MEWHCGIWNVKSLFAELPFLSGWLLVEIQEMFRHNPLCNSTCCHFGWLSVFTVNWQIQKTGANRQRKPVFIQNKCDLMFYDNWLTRFEVFIISQPCARASRDHCACRTCAQILSTVFFCFFFQPCEWKGSWHTICSQNCKAVSRILQGFIIRAQRKPSLKVEELRRSGLRRRWIHSVQSWWNTVPLTSQFQ